MRESALWADDKTVKSEFDTYNVPYYRVCLTLMHNDYSFRIDFQDGFVYSLTIENNKAFAELLTDFYEQTENEKGKYILGDEFSPISISKDTELITRFIPFDCCRKTLVTTMYNFLKKGCKC